MNKILNLIWLEFKFLFRQKFLWLLILIAFVIIVFRMPRFDYDFNYEAFNMPYESLTEPEKLIVDYWNTKKTEVMEQRNTLAQKASALIEDLDTNQKYEREYFERVERYYSKPINLEPQDYLGWELLFSYQTSMLPHNPISLLSIIIISSAGILLLVKDRENKTLFWSSITGKGATFSSFILKMITVFFYGILLQAVFNLFCIIWLWLVTGLDMRHWLHLIQNIPQYGMCDLQLNILEIIIIDIILKCFISILIFLLVFLLAQLLKRYIFLFMSTAAFCGILYYLFYITHNMKNYNIWWRINPFSVFQLDKAITYDAVNIMNHAVDIRVVVCISRVSVMIGLILGAYQMWRKYLYGKYK